MIGAILSLALLAASPGEVEAKEQRDTLLYVATSPPGAAVLVDGKQVGTTDGLFPIQPGVRRVVIELGGHDPHGQEVTIRAGDIQRLKLKLKKRPATDGKAAQGSGGQPLPQVAESYRRISPLDEVLELIQQKYIMGIDRPELVEAAISGMVEKLDERSNYIDQIELSALQEQLAQKLGGIGIELKYDADAHELRVVTPLPQMPAYQAGVRAGDTIVQIDGKLTSEFPEDKQLPTAVALLRGKPGSKVTIGVKRAKSDEVQEISIVRATIRLPAVQGDRRTSDGTWDFMLDEDRKVGYVRLIYFGPNSARQLRAALEGLTSRGMKAFILDLRNCPGGSLQQAVQVADLFIDSGTIVGIKGRQKPAETRLAKEEGTLGEVPMAVLVNHTSASAAEIVAACLQDHRRAVVVGERTYGKGMAQEILELSSGGGALKLSTVTFLRPNGKEIHRFDDAQESDPWGVVPDKGYEVKLSEDEYAELLKHRQQRDVFRPDGPPESDFQDRQLQRAIDGLLQ